MIAPNCTKPCFVSSCATMGNFIHDRPDISYYQADLIVNKLDTDAMLVANQEAAECGTINVQGAAIGNSSALVESDTEVY